MFALFAAAGAVGGAGAVLVVTLLGKRRPRRHGGASGRERAAVTLQQLRAILPRLQEDKARLYLPHLRAAMAEGEITTPKRAAAYLAQLAFESAELVHWRELATGEAYEGRADLGNSRSGDGPRFKGRGPIQLTGRYNYREAGRALGLPLEDSPHLVELPEVGFRVATWYWTRHSLNDLADVGAFEAITRKINGGLRGQEHRERYHARALRVLGVHS